MQLKISIIGPKIDSLNLCWNMKGKLNIATKFQSQQYSVPRKCVPNITQLHILIM